MSKYLVGITGSIGTGKSTVCKLLLDLGYHVIDCDKISHEILDTVAKDKVLESFGSSILDNNLINRKKLGQIVFSDVAKKKQLENILHPIIKEEVLRINKEFNDKISFVEIPLLYETNFKDICNYVIVVSVDRNTQIERIKARDKISSSEANRRIEAQMDLNIKCKLADYVIDNSNIDLLNERIKLILDDLERKCL